jgi:hypothetical protein
MHFLLPLEILLATVIMKVDMLKGLFQYTYYQQE